jgi:16S rRNA (guanine527-N7)-methyltransferase
VPRADWTRTARAHLEALVARYELPTSVAERLLRLLELVVSDPLAPTSVRDPMKALDNHLADSLVGLELAELRRASAIADLGAGAGFPGLPLALGLPRAELVLVESSGRKCAFIEHAILACEVANARVVHARAESWANRCRRFDVVTARALAPLDVVAEYAAPLLRIGGALVVWRGRRDAVAEAAAAQAADTLGLEPREPQAVSPYSGASHRHLHVMSKVRETPDSFPRRPGMARKRPLGRSGAPSDRARR